MAGVPSALGVRDMAPSEAELEAERRKLRSSGGLRKGATVRPSNRDSRANTAKELASLGAYVEGKWRCCPPHPLLRPSPPPSPHQVQERANLHPGLDGGL